MKLLKKIFIHKGFYLFLIPLILFLFGAAFSLYYIVTYDTHFTVMPVVQTMESSLVIPQPQLIDGKAVKGEFRASENNLGAVALRIRNLNNESIPDNFQVMFRIKEKGAQTWYSTNTYSGGQFHELDLFPFGFNLASNSKGKIYVFELFSMGANDKNALTMDQNQKIVSYYQLNKSDLKNPLFVLWYISGKVTYVLHHIGAVFSALIYFLPLYSYVYLIAEKDKLVIPAFLKSILLIKFIRRSIIKPVVKLVNKCMSYLQKLDLVDDYQPVKVISLLNIILFITMLIEIFIIDETNNFLLLLVLILWGISIIVNKIRLQTAFIFALFFLILCFVLFVGGLDHFAEKAAIWTYLFLIIGSFQALFTFRKINTK